MFATLRTLCCELNALRTRFKFFVLCFSVMPAYSRRVAAKSRSDIFPFTELYRLNCNHNNIIIKIVASWSFYRINKHFAKLSVCKANHPLFDWHYDAGTGSLQLRHRTTFWPKVHCSIVVSNSYFTHSVIVVFMNKSPEPCLLLG